MKKIFLIFILLSSFLIGCSPKMTPHYKSREEIILAAHEQENAQMYNEQITMDTTKKIDSVGPKQQTWYDEYSNYQSGGLQTYSTFSISIDPNPYWNPYFYFGYSWGYPYYWGWYGGYPYYWGYPYYGYHRGHPYPYHGPRPHPMNHQNGYNHMNQRQGYNHINRISPQNGHMNLRPNPRYQRPNQNQRPNPGYNQRIQNYYSPNYRQPRNSQQYRNPANRYNPNYQRNSPMNHPSGGYSHPSGGHPSGGGSHSGGGGGHSGGGKR